MSDCSVHLIIVHNLNAEKHAMVLIHLKLLNLPLVIMENSNKTYAKHKDSDMFTAFIFNLLKPEFYI